MCGWEPEPNPQNLLVVVKPPHRLLRHSTIQNLMNPPPISVVAVDDHNLILSGIKHELSQHAGIHLVATGARGQDVLSLIREHGPDVLVLDVEMPENDDGPERFDAIGTIEYLQAHHPKTKIIVVSHESSKFLVNAVVSAGAVGFIDKLDFRSAACLPNAIETVNERRMYFSTELYSHLRTDTPTGEIILTEQQYKALTLLCTYPDKNNSGLATMMSISEGTLKRHLRAAADKLGAQSVRSAMIRAMQLGIVPLRPISGFFEDRFYEV